MEALQWSLLEARRKETFHAHASQILEAAEAVMKIGGEASDWSILIGPEGGIHMVCGSDWPLDSLQAHHRAQMAYRVRHDDRKVRVEGRAGSRTCLFETEKPDGAARLLLARLKPSIRLLT